MLITLKKLLGERFPNKKIPIPEIKHDSTNQHSNLLTAGYNEALAEFASLEVEVREPLDEKKVRALVKEIYGENLNLEIVDEILSRFGTVRVPSGCICKPKDFTSKGSWSYENNGKVYCAGCNREMPEQKVSFLKKDISAEKIAKEIFNYQKRNSALQPTRFAGTHWDTVHEFEKREARELARAIHNLITKEA